ncbi:MAG: hypothetical protein AAB489_03405 [Patescibacteria group bacterium]
MESIRTIKKGDQIYAMFFSHALSCPGVRFLTLPEELLQLGLMEHPAGHTVPVHQHIPQTFDVDRMCEFLYIEKGKVHAHVFDEDWNELGDQILKSGDFLLFLRGGHGIDILEPTRMIEVKQGPFPGDEKSKTYRD